MSERRRTFVDMCLSGDAFADELDDFIDRWHEGNEQIDLHEYLGMTLDEYAIWVERPESLNALLFARKHNAPWSDIETWHKGYAVAARALSAQEATAIVDWLKETGRIPNEQ